MNEFRTNNGFAAWQGEIGVGATRLLLLTSPPHLGGPAVLSADPCVCMSFDFQHIPHSTLCGQLLYRAVQGPTYVRSADQMSLPDTTQTSTRRALRHHHRDPTDRSGPRLRSADAVGLFLKA